MLIFHHHLTTKLLVVFLVLGDETEHEKDHGVDFFDDAVIRSANDSDNRASFHSIYIL
jgi:hypothetical protein